MVIHTSDGEIHDNEWDFLKSQIFDPRNAQPPQEDINKLFEDQSRTLDPNGNPLGSPRKPTGALESEKGIQVADITTLRVPANDNKNLQIPSDPYTDAQLTQQWNAMVKRGQQPKLTIVPK